MTTLVLEDGTGVPGANTYANTGHASVYHAARGTGAEWVEIRDAKAGVGMLVEASRVIDRTYTWLAEIATTTQGLALPRMQIELRDGRLYDGAAQILLARDAVCWLALRMYTDQQMGGSRTIESERIGDHDVTYADGARTYGHLDTILAPLIDSGGLSGGYTAGRLVRWS